MNICAGTLITLCKYTFLDIFEQQSGNKVFARPSALHRETGHLQRRIQDPVTHLR